MQVNASNIEFLYGALNSAFNEGLAMATPRYREVATIVPSSSAYNSYAWMGNLPSMREWLGDRQFKNLMAYKYAIENKDWELTIEVDRNDIEDDQIGLYKPLLQEMGRSVEMHPDELIFPLLAAGNSTLCYDGQFFFDTDHPGFTAAGAPTVYSNWGAGGGALWALLDLSRPLKPLIFQQRKAPAFQSFTSMNDWHTFNRRKFVYGVDSRDNVGYGLWQLAYGSQQTLNETNFLTAYTAMMNLRNDTGKPLNVRPSVIVVGPSNFGAARSLFEVATLTTGGVNPNYNMVKVIVSPYFT